MKKLLPVTVVIMTAALFFAGCSNSADGLPLEEQEGYIKLDLSPYKEQYATSTSLHIQRKEQNAENWETVMYYYANNNSVLNLNVLIPDYYVEKGKTYEYKVLQGGTNLGTYTAKNGLGEIRITPGVATYDSENHALVFTKVPTYVPEIKIKEPNYNIDFQIRYKTNDGTNKWVYFYLNRMKDGNKLYLKSAGDITEALGKTIVPAEGWCQAYKKLTDSCTLCWRAEPAYTENDYPAITVPSVKGDFMNVPLTDLGQMLVTDGTHDFIYEIVNSTGKEFTVSQYLCDMDIWNEDGFEESIKTVTNNDVVIPVGGTHQFKYSIDAMKTRYGNNISIGTYFLQDGSTNRSYGWMNPIITSNKNKKHTVTLVDTASGGWDGQNSWTNF